MSWSGQTLALGCGNWEQRVVHWVEYFEEINGQRSDLHHTHDREAGKQGRGIVTGKHEAIESRPYFRMQNCRGGTCERGCGAY